MPQLDDVLPDQFLHDSIAVLIASGINAPMHAATNTSVGQCAPSSKRENATKKVHKTAIERATFCDDGETRLTHRTTAIANVVTANVCPLGKLEPQYQLAFHNIGRGRFTIIFMR